MKRATVATCALILISLACPAARAELSQAQVQGIIKSSGAIEPKYSQAAVQSSGGRVVIWLTRNPKDDQSDCKVNTLILAKAVMDADDSVDMVTCAYRIDQERYWSIDASQAHVKAYGSGDIEKDRILANIPSHLITRAASFDTLLQQSVGKGPYQAERLNLLNRLNVLSGRGSAAGEPLPTIDRFYPRFDALNKAAMSRVDTTSDLDLLKGIHTLMQEISDDLRAFSALPEARRTAMILDYKKRHGMKVATANTGRVVMHTIRLQGGKQVSFPLTNAEYSSLASRFSDLAPAASVPMELLRRQQIALCLMELSKANVTLPERTRASLQGLEQLARRGDKGLLESQLRQLEREFGLQSLPVLH